MRLSEIFGNGYGSFRRFFLLLAKAKLPYLWLLGDIVASVVIIRIGVSTTEYSAELFAGNVGLTAVVLPFLFYTLLSMALGCVSGAVGALCSARIDRNLRRVLWTKIVRLPLSFYESSEPKELLSRITTDVSSISTLIMQVFLPILTGGYSAFAILGRISSYDSKLMLSLLAVLPVNLVIVFIVGRMRFGVNDLVNRRRAQLTGAVAERAGSMMLVKSTGTEGKAFTAGEQKMKGLYGAAIANNWVAQLSVPVYAIAGALEVIVIILVGRGFYADGSLSLPQWIAYYGFAIQLTSLLSSYCGYWAAFKGAQGSTDRVSRIMDLAEEAAKTGRGAENLSGDIRLEHVDFSFGEKELFRDLSITIPAGKITAIVGPSGSGKTTLINLIDRLYPLQGGSIRIGSDDVSEFALQSYRRALGYVTQESVMYAGTLRENLLQGLEREISEEELDAACAAVGNLDFVRSRPEGYDVLVGEAGASLSGGQRQRFAVARALLKKPDYLLLDEATAAMDIDGKAGVWSSIRRLMAGKTVIYVAHDAQTIANADYLVVLRSGAVEAAGSREEILTSNTYCREMMEEGGEEQDDEA